MPCTATELSSVPDLLLRHAPPFQPDQEPLPLHSPFHITDVSLLRILHYFSGPTANPHVRNLQDERPSCPPHKAQSRIWPLTVQDLTWLL